MWASAYGHNEVVKYLLSLNANKHNKDTSGKTAFQKNELFVRYLRQSAEGKWP